ncbi:MAG: hypothetical protein U5K75_11765 [Ahrensia sp.]|nr:hypothetical protein [Ahrensia sp.]
MEIGIDYLVMPADLAGVSLDASRLDLIRGLYHYQLRSIDTA